MQIALIHESADGKHYPNWDELIRNASDEDEKEYLRHSKAVRERMGDDGFAFGLLITARQECGHYELFQHPVYRKYNADPTENDIMQSVEDAIHIIRLQKAEHRKCTRCICGW